jgi:hypothetical protein
MSRTGRRPPCDWTCASTTPAAGLPAQQVHDRHGPGAGGRTLVGLQIRGRQPAPARPDVRADTQGKRPGGTAAAATGRGISPQSVSVPQNYRLVHVPQADGAAHACFQHGLGPVLDGRPVAVTGGLDGTVQVWDLTTRQPVGQPLLTHKG